MLGVGFGVPGQEAGGAGSEGAEVLDGVFEVFEAGVDGLVEDLLVQGHGRERVAEQDHHAVGHATGAELADDVVDVVETDGRDERRDPPLFGQRPEACTVGVEGLALGQDVDEHVRIEKDVHAHSPYLSFSASARTSASL